MYDFIAILPASISAVPQASRYRASVVVPDQLPLPEVIGNFPAVIRNFPSGQPITAFSQYWSSCGSKYVLQSSPMRRLIRSSVMFFSCSLSGAQNSNCIAFSFCAQYITNPPLDVI